MAAKKPFLLLLLTACFLPLGVKASGLALSPARISVQVLPNQQASAYFTVSNPDAQTQVFEIYPDDLANFIRISPQVFTLGPGGSKQVEINIAAGLPQQTERPAVKISVISHPLTGNNTQVATGAKLTLEIQTSTTNSAPSSQKMLIGLIALSSLIAALAWQKLRK